MPDGRGRGDRRKAGERWKDQRLEEWWELCLDAEMTTTLMSMMGGGVRDEAKCCVTFQDVSMVGLPLKILQLYQIHQCQLIKTRLRHQQSLNSYYYSIIFKGIHYHYFPRVQLWLPVILAGIFKKLYVSLPCFSKVINVFICLGPYKGERWNKHILTKYSKYFYKYIKASSCWPGLQNILLIYCYLNTQGISIGHKYKAVFEIWDTPFLPFREAVFH